MWIAIFVFLAVFLVLAAVLYAFTAASSREVKQTLARLDAISNVPGAASESDMLDVRRQELLSSLPWLNRWLQNTKITPRLRLLLYQADVSWSVGRLTLISVLAGVVCGYLSYLRTGALLLGLLLAIAAGSVPFLYVCKKRAYRFEKFEQYLPEALDLMVSAIRAGHGFSSAMGMAAREGQEPIKREFRQCFDEQNFGLDLRTAMSNLATRVPTQDVRIIVTAVLIQKESGGNLTEILDKVAHLIRERFRLQRQIRVHTAQGRMTGWILSCLPIVLGVALYLINPDNMSLLWTRPIGRKLMSAAGVMIVIGGLIIRKIVRLRV
jgi:tight adherence protein B